VEYLPVIHPTVMEQKNPHAFAERVQVTMAQALNIPVTQYSYEDAALAMEAVKLKLDSKAAILEFRKFEKLYQLSLKNAKIWLHKFLAMDPRKR
jgi:lysophosphatidylcholine acyltransferase/lyso-PAF acetyltransferase